MFEILGSVEFTQENTILLEFIIVGFIIIFNN